MRRAGRLDEYPTDDFRNNPATYIRWMLEHNPDEFKMEAERFGYTVSRM